LLVMVQNKKDFVAFFREAAQAVTKIKIGQADVRTSCRRTSSCSDLTGSDLGTVADYSD